MGLAMRRSMLLVVSLCAIMIAAPTCEEEKRMTENEEYLTEARVRMAEFEKQLEPERLRAAYMALENVSLTREQDPKTRTRLRRDSLSLWLDLLQVLDHHLDPNFNREDRPTLLVQPPPTSDGVAYPPGADPALIDDPAARAKYEEAIAANQIKAKNYRLQIHVGRLDERITERTEEFIRTSYKRTSDDQEEVRKAIEKTIKDPRRKASLLKLLAPRRP